MTAGPRATAIPDAAGEARLIGHPHPRRPVVATLLLAVMAAVLSGSAPEGVAAMRVDRETILVVPDGHVAFVAAFGWIAWLFWPRRRAGDGG